MDAIGGVLCRCTGYRKILAAICDARTACAQRLRTGPSPEAGTAVGSRLVRLDGKQKVEGSEIFGADEIPAETLAVRAIRSPYDRARFRFGDLAAFVREHAGVEAVFTAKDVPGRNCYGVIPQFADQPVFAEGEARFRGEAVAAVVGDPGVVEALDVSRFPVTWEELPAVREMDAALVAEAQLLHAQRAGNVLVRGRVVRGDVDAALGSLVQAESYIPAKNGTLVYFTVTDIPEALQRVTANKGIELMPRTSIGEYGYIGRFIDTEGNIIATAGWPVTLNGVRAWRG